MLTDEQGDGHMTLRNRMFDEEGAEPTAKKNIWFVLVFIDL